jgi:hypothetical protein
VFICDIGSDVSLFGYTESIAANPTESTVKSAFEAITGVGVVSVVAAETGSASNGCAGAWSAFIVEFTMQVGDVPLVSLSAGEAVEAVKGIPPFVTGVSTYAVPIASSRFETNEIFFRVQAVNSVGVSDYAYPATFPITAYNNAPSPPSNLAVDILKSAALDYARVRLKFSFEKPDVPRDMKDTEGHFEIEYDTTPTFISRCSTPVCDATTTDALFSTDAAYHASTYLNETSITFDDLIPGVQYYMRVRACYEDLCSSWAYEGFPSSAVSEIALQEPDYISVGHITHQSSSTLSVDWDIPLMVSEGSNGASIESYTVNLVAPVAEVQNISITNDASDLSAMIALKLGDEMTRCFSVSADASLVEVMIEELGSLDSVDVSLDHSDSTSRHFTVVFDGPVLSNGNVDELQVDWASCANYSSNTAAVIAGTDVVVNTVINGAAHSVFEEFEVLTTANGVTPVTGYFESRYGFRGHMDKIAESDSLSPVNVLVVPGERTLLASTSVSHLLAPGVIMRIGDQEVMVDTVTDGNVSFIPYHIKGSLNDTLYIF